jgi:hypothetical protein
MIYFQCLTKTFADPLVFRKLEDSPNYIIEKTIAEITKQFGKSYPWALGAGRDLPNAYVLPKRKKQFLAGRPIVSFFTCSTFSTHVELHCQDDLPPITTSFPSQPGKRRCF